METFHSCHDDYNIDITSPRDDYVILTDVLPFCKRSAVRRMLDALWCWDRERAKALEVYLRKRLCSDGVEVDGCVLVCINFSYHSAAIKPDGQYLPIC